ncbi:hypothetical protein [Antrihabitans spumae]|uniref:DUF2510 domain-containing protein n=1 Tax=Antrihabitans spumae TaxID=3373370 RepID=A0ABW7KT41_9NOCA
MGGAFLGLILLVLRALVRVGGTRYPPNMMLPPTNPAAPEPGWYVDGSGTTRWHEGREWTDIAKP